MLSVKQKRIWKAASGFEKFALRLIFWLMFVPIAVSFLIVMLPWGIQVLMWMTITMCMVGITYLISIIIKRPMDIGLVMDFFSKSEKEDKENVG